MCSQNRRCCICNKLSRIWKSMKGGSPYCADGCYSTTGFDRRTLDGRTLTPPGYWDIQLSSAEKAAQACLQERLLAQLKAQGVAESQPDPGEQIIAQMMQCKCARQLLEWVIFMSPPAEGLAVLTLLARIKPFDLHWQARIIYLTRTSSHKQLQEMSPRLAQTWGITPRLNWNL